jgi:hypothetical protein
MDIICTSCFTITKYCYFTKEIIYTFRNILKLQSDFSPKKKKHNDWFLNKTAGYCLCGRN